MSAKNSLLAEDPGKRQAILDQAINTFAECGFRGADVQVIADRAGVGKGTVYRYFRNKDELFWAATFEVLLGLERHVFGAMNGVSGACAKVRAAALAYAQYFEINPLQLEMFVQDRAEFRGAAPESHRQYHQKMIQRLERVLQEGIDSGELRPLSTLQTSLTLAGLLHGIVVLACHLSPLPPVQIAEHSINIFLRGLRTDVASEEDISAPSQGASRHENMPGPTA